MADKVRALHILDYLRTILPTTDENGALVDLDADIEWNNTNSEWKLRQGTNLYLRSQPHLIPQTTLYHHVDHYQLEESLLGRFITVLHIQLIHDILTNRAQNEYSAPVIGRLRAKKHDIDKLFDLDSGEDFWVSNVVVVDLSRVNLTMRKTLPLLLAKQLSTPIEF